MFLITMFMMFLFTVVITKCDGNDVHISMHKRVDASTAFGYTNFKIKLKKLNSVKESEKDNIVLDTSLSGGPYRNEPWRNVKIPMPLILNERFRNPKFISSHRKRNKLNTSENSVKLKKGNKTKKINKEVIEKDNHANILNTNFRFAYLARKNKANLVTEQNSKSDYTDLDILKKDVQSNNSQNKKTKMLLG